VAKVVSRARKRGVPGIDRAADEGIVAVPRVEVDMEMRNRVPVELVVHLDRGEDSGKDLRREHHVVPESSASGRRQFEGFHDVSLRHDRDVAR
jgi:hypothetical protein